MQFRDNANLDSSQMGSGGSRGRSVAIGGGAGLLILIVALVFGINPATLGLGDLADSTPEGDPQPTQAYAHCTRGADIRSDRDCRFVAYTNSIQSYWGSAMSEYQASKTTTFTGQIATGCGTATSAVGPFYCPADQTVYLDTGFFDQMLQGQLGARGGEAAEAYVIAHEYGHHISHLIGTLEQAQKSRATGPKSAQVRLELQADCFAGVWFANATKDPDSPIAAITSDDVERAMDAAIAVGDDRIQERSTGRVDRESWTHGSSEQRKVWVLTGLKAGTPQACDTFAAGALD